jgi:hypothetical protein
VISCAGGLPDTVCADGLEAAVTFGLDLARSPLGSSSTCCNFGMMIIVLAPEVDMGLEVVWFDIPDRVWAATVIGSVISFQKGVSGSRLRNATGLPLCLH